MSLNIMMWAQVLLLSFIFQAELRAQSNIDSLKNLLVEADEDTIILMLNQEIGEELLITDPPSAIKYFQNSKMLAEELNDTISIVYSLLNICDYHSILGEYKTAINNAYRALELSGENYELLASCYNRISIEYYHLDNQTKSFENDKLSLKYNRLIGDTLNVAYDMHNIGTYYLDNGKYDSAFYFYQNSNKILNDTNEILFAFNSSRIGMVFYKKEQYDSSLFYHRKALKKSEENESKYDIANENYLIATILSRTGKTEEAKEFINRSLEYTKQLKLPDLFIKNYTELVNINKKNGDFEKALEYSSLINKYSDSLFIKNKENIVKSIELKHQYNNQKNLLVKSELENKLLLKNRKLYLGFIILSIALLAVCVVFIIAQFRQHKKNKQLLRELDFADKSKEKLLSVIGHDLKGSIGNLKGFLELNSSGILTDAKLMQLMPSFATMVDSSYDLLDNLVAWSKNNKEGLIVNYEQLSSNELNRETIAQLSHQAEMKKIKLISIDNDVTFDADRNMILTVLRNLAANAIKFSPIDSSIIMGAVIKNGEVEYSVTDQGAGMSQEQISKVLDPSIDYHSKGTMNEPGSGLGINLCQSFIQKHKGELKIESTPQKGSSFIFTLPLNEVNGKE